MRHVDSIDALSLAACELTIGSFDGIHMGHRQLVGQMLDTSRAEDVPTTVLSFFPHPSVVLRGRKPAFYLSSPDEKAQRLGELGVDYVINQRFDLELSHLRAAQFLDWIHDRLHPKGLWVGPDFALGYQREGNIAYLGSVAAERGFRLHVVEPALVDGVAVSSTRIRQALRDGDVALAGRLLGAPFSLPGEFRGFKAADQDPQVSRLSLEVSEERACPRMGIYAGRLGSAGVGPPALVHVRHAPQSDDDDPRPSEVDIYLPGAAAPSGTRLMFIDHLGPAGALPLPKADLTQALRAAQEIFNQGDAG